MEDGVRRRDRAGLRGCLFLRERPGCYFRVGIAPRDGGPYPHHAPEFQMNEDGLPVGLRLGLAVMLNALAG